MFAADNWCVRVNDKVYGPYSSGQLRKFAHEGRLAGWSLVAPAGSRDWRPAKDETTFSSFFGGGLTSAPGKNTDRAFGRRDDLDHAEAPPPKPRAEIPAPRRGGAPHPVEAPRAEPAGPANFVIIFDVISGAAGRIEPAIGNLGPAFRIADNVWSVNCPLTAIGVRNALSPYLRPNESIFVVDATNGRASWQNYAPEAHSKITQAYVQARKA